MARPSDMSGMNYMEFDFSPEVERIETPSGAIYYRIRQPARVAETRLWSEETVTKTNWKEEGF